MAQNKLENNNPYGLTSVMLARFSAIGDVAMTVPVIYSACRSYPDIQFVLVTRPSMTKIFVNAPANLSVEGIDVKECYKGIGGMYRIVKEMVEKYQIDAFIDLHDVIRTKLMRLFCRIRRIRVAHINKGRSHKRALTRQYNKVMLPLTSQRARYREVFFKVGLPITEHFDGLYNGRKKSDCSIFANVTAPKAEGMRWIGIAPFAAHSGKIYPPELMQQVVKKLSQQPNMKIFLLGGGGREQEILEQWADDMPNVECLAGKRHGFAVELALFNHLDVMLSMDSANMHLASIAGASTISIWGATHPYCGFKGWRQSDSDTIQLPMVCRPCSVFGDKPCFRGDYLCLNAIKPEVVFNKIMEKLKQ